MRRKNEVIETAYQLEYANPTNVEVGSVMVNEKYNGSYKFYIVTKVTKCYVHFKPIGRNRELIKEDEYSRTYIVSPNIDQVENEIMKRKVTTTHNNKVALNYIDSLDDSRLRVYTRPMRYVSSPW